MSGGPVVMVVPSLEAGGSERQLVALAGHLAGGGIATRVIALRRAGALAADLERAEVPWESLGARGALPAAAVAALLGRFRRLRPGVVYAWLHGFDLLAALPARLARVPRVVGSRRELSGWMRPRHRLVQAAGAALCDSIVCVAEAVRADALAAEPGPPSRFVVARNGVDLERFAPDAARRIAARARLGLAPGEAAVVTVANFDREKGHAVWLDAIAALVAGHPRARFLWAGDGPLRAGLEASVRARGLAGVVRFLGRVDDVPALLAAADLFVLPSLSEGLANALLEAMAAGAAIVATRTGGASEVAEDGASALLVCPGDPGALAAAAGRLLADRELAAALGRAARRRAEADLGQSAALARHRQALFGEKD